MGADLYIRSISDKNKDAWQKVFDAAVLERDQAKTGTLEYIKAQKAVEDALGNMYSDDGYFRDSYNNSSVMWHLGISWWQDVSPRLDSEGCLPIVQAQWLYNEVKGRTLDEDKFETEEDLTYFNNKKVKLEEFLLRSITMGEPILCSL